MSKKNKGKKMLNYNKTIRTYKTIKEIRGMIMQDYPEIKLV